MVFALDLQPVFGGNLQWRKGEVQLNTYKPIVSGYYANLIKNSQDADSDHGGSGAVDKLKKAGCVSDDGSVRFDGQVQTYSMCANNYQCTQ